MDDPNTAGTTGTLTDPPAAEPTTTDPAIVTAPVAGETVTLDTGELAVVVPATHGNRLLELLETIGREFSAAEHAAVVEAKLILNALF